MTERAQRIILASRPVGEPTLDNFRLEELPIPQPGPGQMLLRTRWLSLAFNYPQFRLRQWLPARCRSGAIVRAT